MRASSSGGIWRSELAGQAAVGLAHAGVAQLQRVGPERRPALPIRRRARSRSTDTCRSIAMAVRSLGRTPWRIRASIVARWDPHLADRARPCRSAPARRGGRCCRPGRRAMEPPSETPTSTSGPQVRSMSSPSQVSVAAAPGSPWSAREAPRPGRSGATTIVRPHQLRHDRHPHARPSPPARAAALPGLPPPSSTAVDTPASSSRRSVTGARGQQPPPGVVRPPPDHRRPRRSAVCSCLALPSATDLASAGHRRERRRPAKDRL